MSSVMFTDLIDPNLLEFKLGTQICSSEGNQDYQFFVITIVNTEKRFADENVYLFDKTKICRLKTLVYKVKYTYILKKYK